MTYIPNQTPHEERGARDQKLFVLGLTNGSAVVRPGAEDAILSGFSARSKLPARSKVPRKIIEELYQLGFLVITKIKVDGVYYELSRKGLGEIKHHFKSSHARMTAPKKDRVPAYEIYKAYKSGLIQKHDLSKRLEGL